MRLNLVCRILGYSKEQVLRLAGLQVLRNKTVGGHKVFQPESVLIQRFLDLRAAGSIKPFPYSPDGPSALYLWPSPGKPIRRQLKRAKRDISEFEGSKRPILEFVDARGYQDDLGEEYPGLPELFEAAMGGIDGLYVKGAGKRVDRKFLETVFGRGFGIRVEYLGNE